LTDSRNIWHAQKKPGKHTISVIILDGSNPLQDNETGERLLLKWHLQKQGARLCSMDTAINIRAPLKQGSAQITEQLLALQKAFYSISQ
jgi:hypothetical protein